MFINRILNTCFMDAEPGGGGGQPQPPAEPVPAEPTPTESPAPEPLEPPEPFLKIKHLDKEYDLTLDDAKTYAQKGFDYDRIREKYDSSKPVLSFVEELAKDAGYQDVNQYLEAAREWKRQQQLEELTSNNIPEDIAKEIIENRQFREQYKIKEAQIKEQERQTKEYDLFLKSYPDVKADQIPEEVWNEFTSGKSLVDAYAKYENNLLKQELAKYRETEAAKQKNAENSQASTGSVTGQGAANDKLYSLDELKNLSTEDTMKNYSKVMESWKKIKGL
jgi:hypothetical protein